MSRLKSPRVALVITAAVIVLSTLLGSRRSLGALRAQAVELSQQGEYGDGNGVEKDLTRQHEICANVYTVAQRNLDAHDADVQALADFVQKGYDPRDPAMVAQERQAARRVLEKLSALDTLSEQDARYVSNFAAELTSLELTLSGDAYNDSAERFNRVLEGFPANLLHRLTGVAPLPVYS